MTHAGTSPYAGFGSAFLAAFSAASFCFRNAVFSCSRFRAAAASSRSLAAAARCRAAAVSASISSAACHALCSHQDYFFVPTLLIQCGACCSAHRHQGMCLKSELQPAGNENLCVPVRARVVHPPQPAPPPACSARWPPSRAGAARAPPPPALLRTKHQINCWASGFCAFTLAPCACHSQ